MRVEELDGREAGIVVRRRDEAERGQGEVGRDECGESDSSEARRRRTVRRSEEQGPPPVPRFQSMARRTAVEGKESVTHKDPSPTRPPAAATVNAGTT